MTRSNRKVYSNTSDREASKERSRLPLVELVSCFHWGFVVFGIRHGFYRIFKREDGQTLTEYALIIVLVAAVLITSLTLFGGSIVNALQRASSGLGNAVGADSTEFGSTFPEISNGIIKLIYDYRDACMIATPQKAPCWPSSYVNPTLNRYDAFTALGLDHADWWNKPINHIIWTPEGSKYSLSPEPGYVFYVKENKPPYNIITVNPGEKIYFNAAMSGGTGAWNNSVTGKTVDIDTLVLP